MAYSWKLKVGDQETDCKVINRPSIFIEEIASPDGSFSIGKTKWLPMEVEELKEPWEGAKDVYVFMYEDDKHVETWILNDAVISGNQVLFTGVNYVLEAV